MRQVLIRALALLRRPAPLLSFLALAGGGTALVFIPIFHVPGYELGQALAMGLGLLGGVVGIAAGLQESRLIAARDPRPRGALRYDGAVSAAGAAVGAALLLNVAAILPALGTAFLYSAFGTRCSPLAHLGFFPLLTLPSALAAASAGVFCAFLAGRGWRALGLYALLLLGSLAATGWPIYFGPQVYAFNHLLGYFPGPLYDEALELRPPVYWFRLQTVLWAGALWLLCAFCLDMRSGRLGRPRFRPASAMLLVGVVLGALAIEERGPVLGLRMTDRHLEDRLGGVRETPQFRIVYFRGKPKQELDRLERDLAFRHHQLQAFLGDAPQGPIHVYVYRSPAEKQALVGAGSTQFAKPWQFALHINDAPFPHPVLKHELLHVMAAPFGTGPFATTARFGVLTQMAVIEGLAVAGDNRVDDLTLHQWAAAMRRHDLAPDVRALFQPEGFYRYAASRAYTLAGSFLRFLGDVHGPEKLRALYRYGDFAQVYGRPLDTLAAEYEAFLDTVPLDARAEAQAWQRFRRPSLFARSCAREVATLEEAAAQFLHSDPEEALRLYARAAVLQPEEPSHLLGEARALARVGREEEADALLARLSNLLADRPAVEAEVAMLRGDLAWRQGDQDLAADQYLRVLGLQPGPAYDRTARVKLAALGKEVKGPAIQAYFAEGSEDVKLYLLKEALDQGGEDAELHYLLGRRLTQGSAPSLARRHLEAALREGLPELIAQEALRLRIEAAYLSGDCALVSAHVQHLPDLGAAFALTAQEWAERCDFEERVWNGALVPEGPFR
jgi:predicted negative regulator of RcsB-dependent stress response